MNRLTAVALLQLCLMCNVYAAEIRYASVQYSQGVYSVEFDALVSAEQSKIYTLLTDYDHSFWIPPLIGPWVIKNKMPQEFSVMLQRLEQYANGQSGA